ncbi:MAG: hypothetical protein IT287_07120, partial [Bdellovibrionaceae bacterium]|nr:hypothetical protein [Pseudobdellovibrionaceae bacterium]
KLYETHMGDVRGSLHQHMWDSATLYHLTRSVVSELPGIRQHKMRDALALIDDPKIVEQVGSYLVARGLNSSKTYLSEEYDPAEYYYGNYLLNGKHPDSRELSETKEPGKLQEIEDNWSGYDLNVDDCDRTALDEHFSKLKNKF